MNITTSITALAPDTLICIFQHLQQRNEPGIRDFANIMRVCKLFHKIASSDVVWKGVASAYKIPITKDLPVKSQVRAIAISMKKICTMINPLEDAHQSFPFEDTWSMLCTDHTSSIEVKKAAQIGMVRLTNCIINTDCSDDDLVHVIWMQILRQFESGKMAQDCLKTIIKQLYRSKKSHIIHRCIDLAAASSASLSVARCLNELFEFNPLLIFDNPVIEKTLSTLFDSVHDSEKSNVLNTYVKFETADPFIDKDFPIAEEDFPALYMQVAKRIMTKSGCYPNPETVFIQLCRQEPPPSSAFTELYKIYANDYKQLEKKQADSRISKVIYSLGSLILK